MAMTDRTPISKAALRKLPSKAEDGTPYCSTCRQYGELNRMVSTGSTDFRQCEAWSLPVYTDSDRLTYEQMMAGEPCRGCGLELVTLGESPSWVGKGTLYFTDEEKAAYAAAEQAFEERHPCCHALRWSMEGSGISHCSRCCPPHPMSPGQVRRIAQILNGMAEQRVRQAKREGTAPERHELERRLPGRARPVAVALREYEERRDKALKELKSDDRVLLRSSFPEAELMFRWRIQLGCGDITEVVTLGDHRPPTKVMWSWARSRLREGAYVCVDHQAKESPYRRVQRYLTRSTLDLKGDKELGWEPETVGYWVVSLECGHLEKQITPLEWKPEDGHQQTAPNDPDEVARRKARIERVKDCLGAAEYTHAIRRIEQGHLEPDPMTTCWVCGCEQPIIAFQRVGWLVPAKPMKKVPAGEIPVARPTRAQLEKRLADLEAEVARLKDSERAHRRTSQTVG
jgi:hypothetical protein